MLAHEQGALLNVAKLARSLAGMLEILAGA